MFEVSGKEVILNGQRVVVSVYRAKDLLDAALFMGTCINKGWPMLKSIPWFDEDEGNVIAIFYATPVI